MSTDELVDAVDRLLLVDHHVHGPLRHAVDHAGFERLITESDRPIPPWMTQMDSQIGFAIRRHCAPLLGLPPLADAEAYLDRRAELGQSALTTTLLRAAGVSDWLVDTGHHGDSVLTAAEMATSSGARAFEVVRIESVLEDVASRAPSASAFGGQFASALAEASASAVGLKSIVAYRHGLLFDPDRPSDDAVREAAGDWLREIDAGSPIRVTSPVLLRLGLWTAVDARLPLQLHVGYGDPDADLQKCDPLHLTDWIRRVEPSGTPLLLLHCYPFHRHAGYLAQAFPNVYFDVGLALNYVGARASAVLAESLELTPFAKTLFSSDAWGLPELHYLGARLWRRAMIQVLGGFVDGGEWSCADAVRVATMVGRANAERVYRLDRR